MKQLTIKKTVSRTYSLKDGGFYKCQFELEEILEGDGVNREMTKQEYAEIGRILDEQLKEEKQKLGL